MTTDSASAPAHPEPALRRRVAGKGMDGHGYEVLAARRGLMMREGGALGDGGGGDSIAELVLTALVMLVGWAVSSALVRSAAERRPWKIKVYRQWGPVHRRIHSEVIPATQDPHGRMQELLRSYAPEASRQD